MANNPKSLPQQIADEAQNLQYHALHFTKDPYTAQDLVQDTILRALENMHQFDGKNLSGWLWIIMHNKFINNTKRDKKHERALDISDWVHDIGTLQNSVLNEAEANFTESDLKTAIKELGTHIEQPALLRMYGYSYEEIAALTNIPIGTVRSLLFRCRQRLASPDTF